MTNLLPITYSPLFTPQTEDENNIAICSATMREFSMVDEMSFHQKMSDSSQERRLANAAQALFDYVRQPGFVNFLTTYKNDTLRKCFISDLKVISGRLYSLNMQTFVNGAQINNTLSTVKFHLKRPQQQQQLVGSYGAKGSVQFFNVEV